GRPGPQALTQPPVPEARRGPGSGAGEVGVLQSPGRAGPVDLAVVGRPVGGTGGSGVDRPRGGPHDASKNDLKPWLREQWVLPPESDAEFVCAMEDVLEVYQRPYDAKRPVVCLDEQSKQLIREVRRPVAAKPGQAERVDYEYERNGT